MRTLSPADSTAIVKQSAQQKSDAGSNQMRVRFSKILVGHAFNSRESPRGLTRKPQNACQSIVMDLHAQLDSTSSRIVYLANEAVQGILNITDFPGSTRDRILRNYATRTRWSVPSFQLGGKS